MRIYSTVQLAQKLGISRDTLHRWMRAGKIKPGRLQVVNTGGGESKVRLWTTEHLRAVQKFMKQNYRKGRGRKPKPPD
jgi:predicted site-specific integrase-resolvase